MTRRVVWVDPTILFLGQVAVESREGSEEPTIDQVRILGRPDRQPAQGENVKLKQRQGLHHTLSLLPIVARTSDS